MDNLTTEDKAVLAGIVAQVEITFRPFRFTFQVQSCRAQAALNERQRRWLTGRGVAWRAGGGAVDRQNALRSLGRLTEAGLVRMHADRTQRTSVSLPSFDTALSVAPACSLAACWPLLKLIAALQSDSTSLCQGGCIWEGSLAGIEGATDEKAAKLAIVDQEDHAWPLAALNLISAASDGEGRVCYSLTPAGRLAANQEPPAAADLGYEQSIGEAYCELVNSGLREREKWMPAKLGEIAIPLSCGLWSRGNG